MSQRLRDRILTGPLTLTAQEVDNWIMAKIPPLEKSTGRRSKLRGTGKDFVAAARETGLDVSFLVALAAHESAWGCSNIAHLKNNFFGYGAVDADPRNQAWSWPTPGEGIREVARLINTHYVKKRGQNTLRKMRWNNGVYQYATDENWDTAVAGHWAGSPDKTIGDNRYAQADTGGGAVYGPPAPPQSSREYMSMAKAEAMQDGKVKDSDKINPVDRKPTALPPHYHDGEFDDVLPHRKEFREAQIGSGYAFYLRLGDSMFVVPPTQIRVTETSDIRQISTLRQRQSLKVQSGTAHRMIDVSLYFASPAQVNGIPAPGPYGATYYMDGLRSLLAQVKTMPFLPVENEFLNETQNIYAVAIQSISVDTVPGFPGMLKADVTMFEFDTMPFLNKPSYTYDAHFMWPLFRWQYQKKMNMKSVYQEKLRPLDKEDRTRFFIVNEDALQGEEESAIAQSRQRLTDVKAGNQVPAGEGDPAKEYSWVDLNDTSLIFEEFVIPDDLTLISASATSGVSLTPLVLPLTGKPTYQYAGSQDTRFHLMFQTTSRDTLKGLSLLKDRVDALARQHRDRMVSSMIQIDNNFVNLFGVNHVMIESMVTETIPNSPNNFYVAMTLISYDTTQYQNETLDYLNQAEDGTAGMTAADMPSYLESGFDNFIIHEVAAEAALNQMELYPDLQLPTYEEVNRAIGNLNTERKAKGLPPLPIDSLPVPHQGRYVDPDFFLCYPDFDVIAPELFPEVAANLDELFGQKLTEQMNRQDPTKVAKMQELGYLSAGALNEARKKLRDNINDPNQYDNLFLRDAWVDDKNVGEYRVDNHKRQVTEGQPWAPRVSYYYKKVPNMTFDYLAGDDLLTGMLHDHYRYNRRGTMLRAFPTFAFVIIDEGVWVHTEKFWNNYYTYHAVSDINVVMDRKSPIHHAYIELSNVYGALDYNTRVSKAPPASLGPIEALWKKVFREVKEREIAERNIVYDSLKLVAGARVHLRLGYGSVASDLPPVFNGTIAEIDSGDVVRIVAQSDGIELTNLIPADPGDINTMFEEGYEPNEMFRYYLTDRANNFFFSVTNRLDPSFYRSTYGVEHFGYLRRERNNFWQGIENLIEDGTWNTEDYDIMKNIYKTNGQILKGEEVAKKYNDVYYDALQREYNKDQSNWVHRYRQGLDGKTLQDISSYNVPNRRGAMGTTLAMAHYFRDGLVLEPDSIFGRNVPLVDRITDTHDAKMIISYFDEDVFGKKRTQAEKDFLYDQLMIYLCQTPTLWHSQATSDKGSTIEEGVEWQIENFIKPKFINHVWTDWSPKPAAGFPADKFIEDCTFIAQTFYTPAKAAQQEQQRAGAANSLFGESNIRMHLQNKSPWDVFRVCERITPEYIVYPHIHNFHYTLFFGKPWWEVACAYILPEGAKGESISDYKELRKPFSQFHYFSAYEDILSNGIKASGRDLMTAAIATYNIPSGIGESQKATEPVWADYNIRSSFQRTAVMDTTMIADVPGLPFFLELAWDAVKPALFNEPTQWQRNAIRFAASTIAESFRDMYQGELIVLGDPSVKPYDSFYVDDYYTRMTGNAEVGRVIHHFSLETGFITSIKPDLVVAEKPQPHKNDPEDSAWSQNENEATEKMIVVSKQITWGGIYAMAGWKAWSTFKYLGGVKKTSELLRMAKRVNSFSRGVSLARHTAFNTARGALAAMGRVMAGQALIPGVGWASLIVTGTAAAAAMAALNALENMFIVKYRNVIKIFPLWRKSIPYVAGINGHQNLIPGWQDDQSGHPVEAADRTEEQLAALNPNATSGSPGGGSRGGSSSGSQGAILDLTTGEPAKSFGAELGDRLDVDVYWPISGGPSDKDMTQSSIQARISSPYGKRASGMHRGIDMVPKRSNRDIIAFLSGKVVYAGEASGYGNCIIIHHQMADWRDPSGGHFADVFTLYGHMRQSDMRVSAGDIVRAGDLISLMGLGRVGTSSGTHVHWEIRTPKSGVNLPKGDHTNQWRSFVFNNTTPINPMSVMSKMVMKGKAKIKKHGS